MATPPVFTAGSVLTGAQMNAVGLWKITTGSFTSATSVSLPNNTFTSDFAHYKVLFATTLVSTELRFRMRANGTDSLTTYHWSIVGNTASGNILTGAANDYGKMFYGWDTTGPTHGYTFDVFNPQSSTLYTSVTATGPTSKTDFAGIGTAISSATVMTATSFDSMTFISSVASKLTGTYIVYGYND